MKAIEAYQKLLLKINKNDTNSSINISKAEFVLIFNEQKRRWLTEKVKTDQPTIKIADLGNLLVINKPLNKIKDDANSVYFEIPLNFHTFDSSYSLASKGKCKDRPLTNWLVKSRNIPVLLQDTNNSPSFEYEETICIISEGSLVIYTDDFKITNCYLTYYKEPLDIDLAGSITSTGMTSDIDPTELNNEQIEEILNRCALEIVRNYENTEGFQLAQQRINTEN